MIADGRYDIDIRGLLSNSLNEWEGRVAAVVVVGGCNWRCPYCHGAPFVMRPNELQRIPVERVFELLQKQKKWLDGLVVSGGEATLQPGLEGFVREVKERGVPVKLETNGSRPEVVERLLTEGLLDCLALDYKAPLDQRLVVLAGCPESDVDAVKQSYALAAESGIEREYHTTLCPAFVNADLIDEMGSALDSGGLWVLQQYETDIEMIDPGRSGERRFLVDELDEIERAARKHHQRVLMRRGKGA